MRNFLFTFLTALSVTGYAQTSGPELELIDRHHDFGNVLEGEQVKHEFRFRNAGLAPLIIQDVSSPCGCTVPTWPKKPLKSGDTASIPVIFNSEGREGPFVKKLVIKSNAKSSNIVISIAGTVVMEAKEEKPQAVMVFERLSIDFGEIKRADHKKEGDDYGHLTDSFKLTNKGKAMLIIEKVNSSYGGLVPYYSKSPILPGQTTYIKFEHSLAAVGSFNKALTVKTNVGEQVLFIKGLIKPELGPIAYFPVKVVEAGSIVLAKTYTTKFPIINYGDQPLRILAVESDLEEYYDKNIELNYGDTAWISTQITPDNLGQFEYTLIIKHNGRQDSHTIRIIGDVRKNDQ